MRQVSLRYLQDLADEVRVHVCHDLDTQGHSKLAAWTQKAVSHQRRSVSALARSTRATP